MKEVALLAACCTKRRSVSDSDIIVACTAFYTASQLVSICMRCAYFATIGQSFDWREPIGLQERLEGRSSHNGEFSVMSRSRSQGTKVTIVTGDVSHCTRKQSGRRAHCAFTRHVSTCAQQTERNGGFCFQTKVKDRFLKQRR